MLFYNAVECHFEGLPLGKSFGMITKMLFSSLKKYCWLEIVTRNLAFMKGVFAINSGTRKRNFFPTFNTCEKIFYTYKSILSGRKQKFLANVLIRCMIFLIFTFIFTVREGPRAYPTHTLDPSLVLKILVKKIIHRLST